MRNSIIFLSVYLDFIIFNLNFITNHIWFCIILIVLKLLIFLILYPKLFFNKRLKSDEDVNFIDFVLSYTSKIFKKRKFNFYIFYISLIIILGLVLKEFSFINMILLFFIVLMLFLLFPRFFIYLQFSFFRAKFYSFSIYLIISVRENYIITDGRDYFCFKSER